MDGQVAAVTEDYSVRVLSFPVITYCTFGVFDREMRSRLWYPLALDVSGTLGGRRQSKTDQLEPLLLQFVHQDLEYFVRDRTRLLFLTFSIDRVEPCLVWQLTRLRRAGWTRWDRGFAQENLSRPHNDYWRGWGWWRWRLSDMTVSAVHDGSLTLLIHIIFDLSSKFRFYRFYR
jgi:hypothetical protein